MLAALCATVLVAAAPSAPSPTPEPQAITLSLNQAIARGLSANLQYRQAEESVAAATAQLKQARAPQLPSIALQDTYAHTTPVVSFTLPLPPPAGPITISQGLENANNPRATLQYLLFDGGRTASQVGQTAANLAAVAAQQRAAADSTVQTVANGYYQLLEARRLAEVADEAVRVDQAHVKQAQQFLSAGTVARTDVLRAETTLSNDQAAAIRAHNAADLAEASLDSALDYPIGTHLVLTDSIAATAPEISLETLLSAAHANRGELQAAKFAIDAARAAVVVARSGYVPSIALQASEGQEQPQLTTGFHGQLILALNAVWTLYDHGLTAGRIQQAQSQVRTAELAFQAVEQNVDLQVRQAYLNLQAARSNVEAAQRTVAFAEENRRLAEERYKAGVGTAIEIADAQLQATLAEQSLVTALADQQIALVNARYAAGLLGR